MLSPILSWVSRCYRRTFAERESGAVWPTDALYICADLRIDRGAWTVEPIARTLTHASGLSVEMVQEGNGAWCAVVRRDLSFLNIGERFVLLILARDLWLERCRFAEQ